jgi:type VI secretion system protein ImpH
MAGESGLEAAAVAEAYAPSAVPRTSAASAAPADVESADARALLACMFDEPWSFEFFQAVNLLERLLPDRTPVGGFGDPRQEAVRLTTATNVGFPASEIQGLENRAAQPRMTVNFLGLTGPQGALPLAYSLYVAERVRGGDHALKEFLGIFDHRLLSLFYRAWEKTHVAVVQGQGSRDWLTRHLLDLVGLGTTGLGGRLAVRDEALLFYAGLFALPTRPAAGLQQLVSDFFGVRVEVEQFVGAWYSLEAAEQSALGEEDDPSAQLGLGAVAGDEIWDQQSRVRLRLGPLTRRQYDAFLPGGSAHEPLRDLTRFYANDQIDFEIQLILARDDVPRFQLGDEQPLALSWSTWLTAKTLGRDPDDTILAL